MARRPGIVPLASTRGGSVEGAAFPSAQAGHFRSAEVERLGAGHEGILEPLGDVVLHDRVPRDGRECEGVAVEDVPEDEGLSADGIVRVGCRRSRGRCNRDEG